MMLRRIESWLLVFALCSFAHAEARLETVNGKQYRGQVIALAPALTLESDQQTHTFDWSNILHLKLAETSPSLGDDAYGPFIIRLRDGCVLVGSFDRVVGVGPRINTAESGYLVLPRELWQFERRDLPPAVQARVKQAFSEPSEQDRIIVRKTSDALVLRGEIVSAGTDGVEFRWQRRDLTIPWNRVAALAWAGEAAPRAETRIDGRHSVRFVGRISGGERDYLTVRTRALGEVQVPRALINEVHAGLGRMVYLSALTPLRVEQESMLISSRPITSDQSLFANPIQIDGVSYERGLCMHSQSRVLYRLDGRFAEFICTVGIVDDVRLRGDAAVRIYGDGELLWERESLRGDQPSEELAVSVAGVRVLMLEVGYGAGLDLSDHVCWGAARLIRP
jgi:hypothetical protein